jgi:hypothetical protein
MSAARDAWDHRRRKPITMPSNELKRAVRAYAAKHGVSYTTARRALTDAAEQPDAQPAEDWVRAEVVVTELAQDGDPTRLHWKITVFDPRADSPMQTTFYLPSKTQERLDELADVRGWRRLPGQTWPAEPTAKPVDVRVERSDLGRRNDQANAILKAAGLTAHEAHDPYITAVAHELQRAGVEVLEWFANPDDPRNGAIELADPMPGYEQTHIAWREDMGWYYMPSSDSSSAHADRTIELEVGFLDEPHEVAAAACKALDRPFTTERPDWRPPADYNPDAVAPEGWDASPDFERALTCYTTYPGWDEYKNPKPPAPVDDRAPDLYVEDPFTRCWRSWSRAQFSTIAPELTDDGTWLRFDITIAGESFDNHDGMLQFRRGHDNVAYWLKGKGAPVGSVHGADAHCRVCHDDYDFEKPTDLAMLEHRGQQIRAAYERLNGIEPGQGAFVLAERDGDVLVLTLRLITPPVATPHTRLRAFQFRSDSLEGWIALVESDEHPGWEIRGTALLNAGSWKPREIGRSFESMCRYYNDAGPSEEPATLEQLRQRAHQVRAAAEELLDLEPHTGITVHADREGDVLVASLLLTDAAPRTRLIGFEWRSDRGWLALAKGERWPVETAPAGVPSVFDRSVVAAALVASIEAHR